VDVAAVANVSGGVGVVFAACVTVNLLRSAMHILNRVFDSNIVLLASFLTAVDN